MYGELVVRGHRDLYGSSDDNLYEMLSGDVREITCKLSRNSLSEFSAFRPSASDHFLLLCMTSKE